MARIVWLSAVLLGFSAVAVNFSHTLSVAESRPQAALDAILNLAKEFDDFKLQLNSIDTRLNTLQKSIMDKSSPCGIRCCVQRIIQSIRKFEYKIAEQELIELNNAALIPSIVNDVYAGSSRYLDILLDFVTSMKSPETRLLVCSALLDAMRSNFNIDPIQMIVLAGEIQKDLPRLRHDDAKQTANELIADIVKDIKTLSVIDFEVLMRVSRFQGSRKVDTLATALYDFRSDVANEVMEGFVEKVFGVFPTEEIIGNISSCKHTPLVIVGLAAAYNRSNLTGNLDKRVTLSLASSLNKLQQREDYSSVATKLKNDVEELMLRLPTCVANLFIAKNVCLWNKEMQMYLYAAENSRTHSGEPRRVLVHHEPKPGASWIVETNGTEFFFKSVEYENEYLYPTLAFNDSIRNVGTRAPDSNGKEQMAWSVELDRASCFFNNVFYNELLFTPDSENMNLYVFTSFAKRAPRLAYEWEVRNCENTVT